MENPCNEKFNFATGFIREQRKVWSLQNDVDLLNNLESFSQSLMKKTCFIMDSMDEFHREINMTSIGVKTLSNTLEGVSDSQFVENRVYDEEDDMICEEDKNKNDSISLDLNNRLQESLKLCSKTLESKFEAVSITMSDSEDDVDIFNKGEVILIPKNIYKSRPLPHMIGGKDFYLDDSLGLLPSSYESEDGEENLFSGEDDVRHSESSDTDEVDNSFQKNDLFNNTTSEIKHIDTPEQNESYLTENKEDDWKGIGYQDEQCVNDNSRSKMESQSTIENFSPLSFQKMSPGVQINAAIADEIRGIFGEEKNEGQARLPIFRKTQNPISRETFKDFESVQKIKNDSSNTQEIESPKHIPTNFNSSEPSVFSKTIHSKTSSPDTTNDYREEKMSDESVLPIIPTEVLHSFAKSRAKIKGKRRLPTRRLRNIILSTETDIEKPEARDNVILSPSTDEEDLFVLPHVHVTKESSSDSLFSAPSLFSPGSSIEGEKKSLFLSSKFKTEDKIDVDKKDELMDEPLGIKKNSFHSDKRNSHFFSDWDPFNSEECALFSSVERKARKTKLFDDFNGSSEKSTKNDDDDDIFSFHSATTSNSASSLFSGSLSTVDFSTNKLDSSKPTKLFIDNDNGFGKNLFSSSNCDDLLFRSTESSTEKLNFIPKPDFGSEKNSNELVNDKKLKNVLCSNPLMDTEDNLFD